MRNRRSAVTSGRTNSTWLIWTVLTVMAVVLSLVAVGAPSAQAALPSPTDPSPAHGETVTSIPTFSWSAVADAARYRIQVAADDGFTGLRYEAEVTSPNATPTADLGAGTYYWRVMPQASDGSGSYGATWRFERTARTGPALITPENAKVLDYPEDAPVLRWSPLASVSGYQVQLSTSESFPSGSATTTKTTTAASYALTSLEAQDRALYWRVRGSYTTANGRSTTTTATTEWSEARHFSMAWETDSFPGNSTPVLLEPADNPDPGSAMSHPRFSWTAVPGAAKYRIQISAAPDFTDIRVDREVVRTTYVGPGTLQAGAYYWRVAALDQKSSRGPWSADAQFYRAWLDGTLPARPTLSAADGDAATPAHEMPPEEFLVQWTPIPGASHYEVQISGSQSFGVPSMTCKTPHTALTPVQYGTYKRTTALSKCDLFRNKNEPFDIDAYETVYVRVRGVDATTGAASYPNGPNVAEVYSLWSNQARTTSEPVPPPFRIDFTPLGSGTPEEPAQLTAPIDQTQHTDAPVLAWKPVTGATAYRVALSTDQGFRHYETGDGKGVDHVIVRGTRLVLLESLKDNTAGESFYWYVLPCRTWVDPGQYDCRVGDEQAVNVLGKFRKFKKVAPAPTQPVENNQAKPMATVSGDDVRFAWRDLLATEQAAAAAANGDPSRSFETGGIRYYELEVSADPDFSDPAKRVLLTRTDATQIVPEVRWERGQTYYFRVRGHDGGGNALAWSVDRCAGGPGGTPCKFDYEPTTAAPNMLALAGGGPVPTLKWSPVAAAASYEVEIFTGQDPSFPQGNRVEIADAESAFPAWTPSTLPAGQYSWRVRKIDMFRAAGAWSTPADGNWRFSVSANAVTNMAPATGSLVAARNLVFSWGELPGAARYQIQVSTSPAFDTVYESAVTTNTSWSPVRQGGYAAGRYYWRVQALNSSATANILSTTAPQALDVMSRPGMVTGLTATSTARGTVNLSWTPRPAVDGGARVTGYRVWYRVPGTAWEHSAFLEGNIGSARLTGAADSTTYEFKVAAVNSEGIGADSSVARATTPSLPTAPRVTVSARDHGLRVSWSGAASRGPITSYQVWYRPVGTAAWTKRSVTRSPLELTGLAQRAYQVQVAAVSSIGMGPFGTVSPIRPLSSPSAPRAVTLRPGSRQVSVTWAPPASPGSSAVTSYVVAYRTATSMVWRQRSTTARSIVLSGLSAGHTYLVRVSARNAVGIGAPSPDVRFVARSSPGRPSGLTAKVSGRSRLRTVSLRWAPPSAGAPFTSYQVQVATLNGTWSTAATTGSNRAVWRRARQDRTYKVRVRALNALGWGPFSTTRIVRT